MSIAETFLPEFDSEMASTRKALERVPDDKLDWKAHPKSNTIGWVASHIVEIPGWIEGTLTQPEWDVNPTGTTPFLTPMLGSRQEMLKVFDEAVVAGRKAIASTSDAEFLKDWSLLDHGNVVITMPRASILRSFILNHLIHHRAILCVYLRLNNIPVPGMYGPSGDEG